MYDFYVVLGCFGLKSDDFVSCGSVENIILKVNASVVNYNNMIDYFDQCRLFDKPMFDINGIRHVVFNLQDRYDQLTKPLWSQKRFELYQKFIIDHRYCGLFLKLSLPDAQDEHKFSPEEIIKIEKPEKLENEIVAPMKSKTNLTLIRGRK